MDDYTFKTEPLPTTSCIISEFIERELDKELGIEITYIDGSYAECLKGGVMYKMDAMGDGDFENHRIKFTEKELEG